MTQLTYGQKAVGLTFNPSGDPRVQKLKELYAEIIDICNDGRRASVTHEIGIDGKTLALPVPDITHLWSIAITQAMDAQMWAVKAATWKD